MKKETLNKRFTALMDPSGKLLKIIDNHLIDIQEGDYLKCQLSGYDLCEYVNQAIADDTKPFSEMLTIEEQIYMISAFKEQDGIFISIILLTGGYLTLLQEENDALKYELDTLKSDLTKVNEKLEQHDSKLMDQTIKDTLTGAYNRVFLDAKFDQLKTMQKRLKHAVAFIYIDLNYFKLVNASFGYEEGDRLLIHFTAAAMKTVRKDFDYVFRIGPDEFVILMVECPESAAKKVCERINEAYRKHTVISSISYGIIMVEEQMNLANCLSEAEHKMLLFKESYLSRENFGEAN